MTTQCSCLFLARHISLAVPWYPGLSHVAYEISWLIVTCAEHQSQSERLSEAWSGPAEAMEGVGSSSCQRISRCEAHVTATPGASVAQVRLPQAPSYPPVAAHQARRVDCQQHAGRAGIPCQADQADLRRGWSPAELNSILQNHVVRNRDGWDLTTFGCVEW